MCVCVFFLPNFWFICSKPNKLNICNCKAFYFIWLCCLQYLFVRVESNCNEPCFMYCFVGYTFFCLLWKCALRISLPGTKKSFTSNQIMCRRETFLPNNKGIDAYWFAIDVNIFVSCLVFTIVKWEFSTIPKRCIVIRNVFARVLIILCDLLLNICNFVWKTFHFCQTSYEMDIHFCLPFTCISCAIGNSMTSCIFHLIELFV